MAITRNQLLKAYREETGEDFIEKSPAQREKERKQKEEEAAAAYTAREEARENLIKNDIQNMYSNKSGGKTTGGTWADGTSIVNPNIINNDEYLSDDELAKKKAAAQEAVKIAKQNYGLANPSKSIGTATEKKEKANEAKASLQTAQSTYNRYQKETERRETEKKQEENEKIYNSYADKTDEELEEMISNLRENKSWVDSTGLVQTGITKENEEKAKEIESVLRQRTEKSNEEWYADAKKEIAKLPDEDEELIKSIATMQGDARDIDWLNSVVGAQTTTASMMSDRHDNDSDINAAVTQLKDKGYTTDEINDLVKKQIYLNDKAQTEETQEQMRDYATSGIPQAIASTAFGVLASPVNSVFGVKNAAEAAVAAKTGEKVNTYSPNYFSANTTNEGVSAITEELGNATSNPLINKGLQIVYGGTVASAQSAYMLALSTLVAAPFASVVSTANEAMDVAKMTKNVAEVVNLTGFSTGKFTTSYKDAIDRGASNTRALETAIAQAVNESLFEKISLDNLLKMNNSSDIKKVLLQMFKQGAIEGSEEAATDMADTLADIIINVDKSEYMQTIADYEDQGYTHDEAVKKTTIDYGKQIGEDFAVGLVSGLMNQGNINALMNSKEQRETGKAIRSNTELTNEIKDRVKETAKDGSREKALAQKEKTTNADVADMVSFLAENEENIEEEAAKVYENEGQSKEEAKESAKDLAKKIEEGTELSDADSKVLGMALTGELTPNKTIVNTASEYATKAKANQVVSDRVSTNGIKADDIKKIDITEDGITLKTSKGTVKAAEASWDNSNTAKFVNNAASIRYSNEARYNYVTGYDGSISAREYNNMAAAVTELVQSAREDKDIMDVSWLKKEAGKYLNDVLKEQIDNYDTAKLSYVMAYANKRTQKMQENATSTAQKEAVKAWSDAIGKKVVIGGRDFAGTNGFYDEKTDTIYLSPNAVNPLTVTFAHELVHNLSKNNKESYDELKDATVGWLKSYAPEDYKRIYENRKNTYKNEIEQWKKEGLDWESLLDEEIVAHSTEAIMEKLGSMNDEELEEFGQNFYEENQSLFKQILSALEDFLGKIKNALKGYHSKGLEGQVWFTSKEKAKQLEHIVDVWNGIQTEMAKEKNERSFQEDETTRTEQSKEKEQNKKGETKEGREENTKKMFSKKAGIEQEISNWFDNNKTLDERKKYGGFFVLGRTSKAMKEIGLDDKEIIIGKSKIGRTQENHDEMTDDMFVHICDTIENPIIIMDSATKKDALVFLSDIKAKDSDNIEKIAILTMKVSDRRMEIEKYIVTNFYGKEAHEIQHLLNTQKIYYIDPNKNRTDTSLSVLRVQSPSTTMKYGSIRKITQSKTKSNTMKNKKTVKLSHDTNGKELSEAVADYFPKTKVISENESVNNDNPTKEPDIMKELKNRTTFDPYYEHLAEEVKADGILAEGFKALKNAKPSATKLREITNEIAVKMLNEFNSAADVEDLTDDLTLIFGYINKHPKANYTDMMRIMAEVGTPIVKEAGHGYASEEAFDFAMRVYQEYFEAAAGNKKEEIEAAKEKLENERIKLQNKYRDKINREKNTQLRQTIATKKARIDRMLRHPKPNTYIPRNMMRAAVELADIIDTGTKSKDALKRISVLKDLYEKVRQDQDYSEYDETTYAQIESLRDEIKKSTLKELSMEQLEKINDVLDQLLTQAKNQNKLLSVSKYKNAVVAKEKLVEQIMESDGFNRKNVFSRFANKYAFEALNFERVMKMMTGYVQDSVGDDIANGFKRGELQEMTVVQKVTDLFAELTEGKENRKKIKWLIGENPKDWVSLNLGWNSEPVKVPAAFRLSLAMHAQNEDNLWHILRGGITLPDMYEYRKGNIAEAYANGKVYHVVNPDKLKKDILAVDRIKREEFDSKQEYLDAKKDAMHRLELEKDYGKKLFARMTEDMTDYEKEFLKKTEFFFHEYTGNLINAVSLQLNGYKKATVENYFPINTDKNFTARDFDSIVKDASIEGMGFLKERVVSYNPLYLEDITQTITRQTQNVARYVGWAKPMRDMNKLLKMTYGGTSLKKAISAKYGRAGMKYIEDLMADLTGSRGADSNFFDVIRSNMAGAVLTLNPSVAIKQAASFTTAAGEVGWAAVAYAATKIPQGFDHFGGLIRSKGIKEIEENTPLLRYRATGYSNQELGDIAKRRTSFMSTNDLPMSLKWIEKMDIGTVRTLEHAAVYWVDHNTDLKKNINDPHGKENYWNAVTEKFNDIIRRTQPNYSTLQKPEIIRDPNRLVKQIFMYKTQPLANYGIVFDAVGEMKAANKQVLKAREEAKETGNKSELEKAMKLKKKAGRKLSDAITSNLISSALFSAMTIVANAVLHRMKRYKDEDDEWDENLFMEEFIKGVLSTTAGMFIGGSELYSILESKLTGSTYYGLDVGALQSMDNLYEYTTSIQTYSQNYAEAKNDTDKEKAMRSLKYYIKKVGFEISNVAGIPANNVYRIVNAIYAYTEDVKNGDLGKFTSEGIDKSTDSVETMTNRKLGAVLSNDMDKYEDYVMQNVATSIQAKEKTMDALPEEERKAEEDTYHEQIAKALKDSETYGELFKFSDDDDMLKAYEVMNQVLQDEKGITAEEAYYMDKETDKTLTSLYNTYTSEKITYNELKKILVNEFNVDEGDIYFKIKKLEYDAENNSFESFNKYTELGKLLLDNKDEEYQNLYEEFESYGLTETQITNGVKGVVTDEYANGNIEKDAAKSALEELGIDDETIYWTLDKANAGDDYVKYGNLTDALIEGKGYSDIISEMKDAGMEEDSIASNVENVLATRYANGEITKEKAGTALEKIGYDENDVYWAKEKLTYAKENGGDASGYNKWITLTNSLEKNSTSEETINKYLEHGLDASKVRSKVTDWYHDYLRNNGNNSAVQANVLSTYVRLNYAAGKTGKKATREYELTQINKWIKENL